MVDNITNTKDSNSNW